MTPRTWYLAVSSVILLIVAAALALAVRPGTAPRHHAAAGSQTRTHPASSPVLTSSSTSSGPSSPRPTPPASLRSTQPPPRPTPTRTPTPDPTRTPHPTPTPTTPTPTTPAPQPTAPYRPAVDTLAIPAQQVDAPIDGCRVVDGGVEPPQDVRRTCYWTAGASLSARRGTTVVVGQCDWAGRVGALGRIGALQAGDTVLISGADARVTAWRVATTSDRPKRLGVPPGTFAGRNGPRRLYLISCGGRFDAARQSYLDNVYVLARPAG